MEIVLLEQARKDRDYWKKSGNTKIQNRISALLKDILQHPFIYRHKKTRTIEAQS